MFIQIKKQQDNMKEDIRKKLEEVLPIVDLDSDFLFSGAWLSWDNNYPDGSLRYVWYRTKSLWCDTKELQDARQLGWISYAET